MKRKRSIFFLIIMSLVFVMLIGCAEKKQNNIEDKGKTEQTEPKATKEYIIEKFDLTDADLNGIDLDKLIEYYGFSEEVINEKTKDTIVISLTILQEMMETEIEDAKYDFQYLVEAPEFAGEYPSFDEIKYLAYFKSEAEAGYSYFFDFDKNKIYYLYGGIGVYEDYRRANQTYELTDEIKKTVVQTLKEAEVNKWEYYYESGEYREPVHWYFGMEFEDSTVVSNT